MYLLPIFYLNKRNVRHSQFIYTKKIENVSRKSIEKSAYSWNFIVDRQTYFYNHQIVIIGLLDDHNRKIEHTQFLCNEHNVDF